ncbi:AAA domain [Babesia ovis]|uniref:AAA domain n=1 Tax=Babesia ovis TaxID=5869 RepID=A0A9W5WVI2_BABOV|nr:AAA domain [Babesia ovis]
MLSTTASHDNDNGATSAPPESSCLTTTSNVIDPKQMMALQKRAIELLRLSDNTYLGCRDEESRTLSDIIKSGIESNKGRAIFVFGVSGTGKTTTVTHVVSQFQRTHPDIDTVYMSGSSFVSPWNLIRSIFEDVTKSRAVKSRLIRSDSKAKLLNYREVCSVLSTAFKSVPGYTLCVMDEVDYLQCFMFNGTSGRNSNWMLQALLAASHSPGSRVLFIAVSNNLQLATLITEKQCDILLFKPYTEKQIIAIIKGKLSKLEGPYTSVIKDTSILLLARRVANTTGDLRACLDTFTRAIANSLSNLEEEIDQLTIEHTATSYENTPVRYGGDVATFGAETSDEYTAEFSTPKRAYGDTSNIELSNYQVDHRDIGSLTPTLSLSKTALLEMKLKALPLLQLLTLLAICKAVNDEGNNLVSLNSVKMSLLHLGDMLSMDKVGIEDFCVSQLNNAIDMFKELGIVSKSQLGHLSDAIGDEFVTLLADSGTITSVVLPISPAFVGLDLEFPIDDGAMKRYSKIGNSFNIKLGSKRHRRRMY